MLLVLGLFLIAVGMGLSVATGTMLRTRIVNGYAVQYQVTIQPFFDVGVSMVPIGLIVLAVAFIMTRVTTQPKTPPAQVKRSRAGFAISLIAGIMSFLFGLSYWNDSLAIPRGGWSIRPGPTAPPWFAGANLGALGAIATVSAIIVIIGAILMYAPGKETVGRILVIAFSVIGFITLGTTILFNVGGIIGGTLGLSKTSMKAAAKARLARTQTLRVNLRRLSAFLLLITIAVATVFWAGQRVEMHTHWASQAIKTESVMNHLYAATQLLNSTSFGTDEISQEWFSNELMYAANSLQDLGRLDTGHQRQLSTIVGMTMMLCHNPLVLGQDSAGRNTLAESLQDIGWKVKKAYSNFVDSYGTDRYTGPLFSYSGPSPPDEILLQQAVDLADSISAKTVKK
jgi:hypothetical protein